MLRKPLSQFARFVAGPVWDAGTRPILRRRWKGQPANVRDANSILVIRHDDIGDVVLTTPLLRELRRAYPNAWIGLAIKPTIANLMETCPYINEVIPLTIQPLGGNWQDLKWKFSVLKFARSHLWPHQPQLAIAPRWDEEIGSASMAVYMSGAAHRVGYDSSGAGRLFTRAIHDCQTLHEVQHNLRVLENLGISPLDDRLELWPTPADHERAAAIVDGESPIAICPGTRLRTRNWPIERYIEVARALMADGQRCVVIGGPQQRPQADAMKAALGPDLLDTIGQLTLRETTALLARCALYVGGDTGPMHLAAAVGTPVVCVSCHPMAGSPDHANAPERFGPWKVPSRVVRPQSPTQPCTNGCESLEAHCILKVPVQQVIEAARDLLRVARPTENAR